jgi:ubiquinone/menaquinone biosynthesis C-methylase UbiE
MPEQTEILRAGEYFLAVQGLAMIRSCITQPSVARRRVEEIRNILGHFDKFPHSLELPITEYDVEAGYSRWSRSYDGPNPAIEREEPVVRGLLAETTPGTALDAACGTGRLAAALTELGHKVIGVDATEAMLGIARGKLPDADFRRGSLDAMPVEDASIDVLTCALALEHVRDLGPVFREFARVLRPGGQAILSDMHPVWKTTGGVAGFPTEDGSLGVPFVAGFTHQLSEYIDAFLVAGFTMNGCIEPRVSEETLSLFPSNRTYPEATREAFLGLPFVVIWHLTRS